MFTLNSFASESDSFLAVYNKGSQVDYLYKGEVVDIDTVDAKAITILHIFDGREIQPELLKFSGVKVIEIVTPKNNLIVFDAFNSYSQLNSFFLFTKMKLDFENYDFTVRCKELESLSISAPKITNLPKTLNNDRLKILTIVGLSGDLWVLNDKLKWIALYGTVTNAEAFINCINNSNLKTFTYSEGKKGSFSLKYIPNQINKLVYSKKNTFPFEEFRNLNFDSLQVLTILFCPKIKELEKLKDKPNLDKVILYKPFITFTKKRYLAKAKNLGLNVEFW